MFSRMTGPRFEAVKASVEVGPGSYEIPTTLDSHGPDISLGPIRSCFGQAQIYDDDCSQVSSRTPRSGSRSGLRFDPKENAPQERSKSTGKSASNADLEYWKKKFKQQEQQFDNNIEEIARSLREEQQAKEKQEEMNRQLREALEQHRREQQVLSQRLAEFEQRCCESNALATQETLRADRAEARVANFEARIESEIASTQKQVEALTLLTKQTETNSLGCYQELEAKFLASQRRVHQLDLRLVAVSAVGRAVTSALVADAAVSSRSAADLLRRERADAAELRGRFFTAEEAAKASEEENVNLQARLKDALEALETEARARQAAEHRVQTLEEEAALGSIERVAAESLCVELREQVKCHSEHAQHCEAWREQNGELLLCLDQLKKDCVASETDNLILRKQVADLEDLLEKVQKAVLNGHSNHKQKICHMVQVKEENVSLRAELKRLRQRSVSLETGTRGERVETSVISAAPPFVADDSSAQLDPCCCALARLDLQQFSFLADRVACLGGAVVLPAEPERASSRASGARRLLRLLREAVGATEASAEESGSKDTAPPGAFLAESDCPQTSCSDSNS